MNKKGDVPTILLVIVALVLSVATLFIMLSFGGGVGSKSAEVSILISGVEFNYNYIIESTKLIASETIKLGAGSKERFKEIADKRNIQIEGQGNFFGHVRTGEFSFTSGGAGHILNVGEPIFVEFKRGVNHITRTFNLCMEFDGSGKYIKDC